MWHLGVTDWMRLHPNVMQTFKKSEKRKNLNMNLMRFRPLARLEEAMQSMSSHDNVKMDCSKQKIASFPVLMFLISFKCFPSILNAADTISI